MRSDEILELANKILEIGAKQDIYEFLKQEGAYVQSYSSFTKNYRDGFFDSYREDLVYKYFPDEDEQERILKKLRL